VIARLESGEVLLTTSIAEVSVQVVESVLARDAALSQCDAEGVAVQLGHPGSLPEREPAAGVEATGEFDLHVALPFARPQWQAGEGLLVEIESDAHGRSVAHSDRRVKTPATQKAGYRRESEARCSGCLGAAIPREFALLMRFVVLALHRDQVVVLIAKMAVQGNENALVGDGFGENVRVVRPAQSDFTGPDNVMAPYAQLFGQWIDFTGEGLRRLPYPG